MKSTFAALIVAAALEVGGDAAVVDVVRDTFASHRFHLLEPLAETIVGRILEKFDAQWASIELSKSGVVPNARDVGVRIERSR